MLASVDVTRLLGSTKFFAECAPRAYIAESEMAIPAAIER